MARTLFPVSPYARPLPKAEPVRDRPGLLRGLATLVFLLTVFSGCPKPKKTPTTPADLPTTTRDYVQHFYSLSWNEGDFTSLKMISLDFAFAKDFPGEVEIVPTVAEGLTLTLEYHVQNENHAIRARQYLNTLTTLSRPLGDEPKFVVPEAVQLPPELRCARETLPGKKLKNGKSEPRVERVLGVCPAKISIQVPATLPKSFEIRNAKTFRAQDIALERLDLVLSPGSNARIRSIRGDIKLSGGDSETSVSIDGLSAHAESELFSSAKGSLSANLDAIRDLILTRIEGPIGVALDHPTGANVRINGEVIHDFPYPHP